MIEAEGRGQSTPIAPPRSVRRPILLGALVVLAALASFRTVATALQQTYGGAYPEQILAIAGPSPRLLATAASNRLSDARTAPELTAAYRLAMDSLLRSPFEVEAVRDLALIAGNRGQGQSAAKLMQYGSSLSRRDRPTQLWLMDYGLRRGDWAQAMTHADAFLRTDLPAAATIGPVLLVAAASSPSATAALARQMAAAPPWRSDVLSSAARTDAGQAALPALLNALQRDGATLSGAEVEQISDGLLNVGSMDLAFLVWAQAAPANSLEHVDNVFQGDFSSGWGPPPFGWRLQQPTAGAVARSLAPAGGGSSLKVELDDSGQGALAQQALLLAPGRYVLTGRGYAANDVPTGQSWTLRCRDGKLVAEIAPALTAGRWTGFRSAFQLAPSSGCDGQWLTLESRPQSSGGRGRTTWWTGLALDRIENVD